MRADIELTDEFEHALKILSAGDHLFLTGNAGTGKSTLIRHYLATTDRRIVVAAPTGIAALNVGGYTIHRLFSLSPSTTLDDVKVGDYRPGRFAKTLKSVDTLIIDEASMVRADLFDKVAAALERYGPSPGVPFGGVQVVLVGDLLQLPPVVEPDLTDFFTREYASPYFFSATRFRREDFPTVSLTKVFRQTGDTRLTSILNAIRDGVLLEQARNELNNRVDEEFTPDNDEFWLTLAPTNRVVGARNKRQLAELPGWEFRHEAFQSGDLDGFEHPVDRTLRFKIGAQIMMVNNDAGDRWVNGSLGRIVDVLDTDDSTVVVARFRDGSEADVVAHTWDVTRPMVTAGTVRHETIGTFTQLPFKLAWAITIHKSQGQTVDRLVVDLSGGAFDYGQVYVALSRCTSMDGLVLKRPVFAKDLKVDRRVVRFLKSAGEEGRQGRRVGLGMVTIGDEGRMSRPRPVEIAAAFDDGSSMTTLVNPQRDLADARKRFGISVDDVLLAPSLAEAWSVFEPLLAGSTPVGVGTDDILGLIDFELKRLGTVTQVPLGIDLRPAELTEGELTGLAAPKALDRARAARDAGERVDAVHGGAGTFDSGDSPDAAFGYLLTRDPEQAAPAAASIPTLSNLLGVSRAISAVILRGDTAEDASGLVESPAALTDPTFAGAVRSRLAGAIERSAGVPDEMRDRLHRIDALMNLDLADTLARSTGSSAGEALLPGTRVCFTGKVLDPSGRAVSKPGLQEIAEEAGLQWAENVTKTRCDVLVVAEVGTQSGKARKAKEFGKPVLSAEEFFDWLAGD